MQPQTNEMKLTARGASDEARQLIPVFGEHRYRGNGAWSMTRHWPVIVVGLLAFQCSARSPSVKQSLAGRTEPGVLAQAVLDALVGGGDAATVVAHQCAQHSEALLPVGGVAVRCEEAAVRLRLGAAHRRFAGAQFEGNWAEAPKDRHFATMFWSGKAMGVRGPSGLPVYGSLPISVYLIYALEGQEWRLLVANLNLPEIVEVAPGHYPAVRH